jgi:hypothetical protein
VLVYFKKRNLFINFFHFTDTTGRKELPFKIDTQSSVGEFLVAFQNWIPASNNVFILGTSYWNDIVQYVLFQCWIAVSQFLIAVTLDINNNNKGHKRMSSLPKNVDLSFNKSVTSSTSSFGKYASNYLLTPATFSFFKVY